MAESLEYAFLDEHGGLRHGQMQIVPRMLDCGVSGQRTGQCPKLMFWNEGSRGMQEDAGGAAPWEHRKRGCLRDDSFGSLRKVREWLPQEPRHGQLSFPLKV